MVIDMHAHLWGGRYRQDAEEILKAMDAYSIDEVFVSGLHSAYPDKDGVAEANREVARFAKENPNKIRGYVYVSAEHDNALDVVKRGIEDDGMVGVKIWISTFCDDPCCFPVVEKAIDYGVPVLLHSFHKATEQCEFETTGVNVANLARRYPEAKLIMAHISGNAYDGVRAVRDIPNVWVDYCCSIFQQDALAYAIEELGADRLLHGSDMPGTYLVNLGQTLDLDLDEESREKILWKNTRKIFDTNFRLGGKA